jgi:hypothetical protein
MTMPNAAHPDPERLAALAGGDADARADSALLEHVASCDACDRQVTEMSAVRVALAQLPDLAPSRPLQLVPPVTAPSPSGWRVALRRAFAPVAVAGMVLVLVGGVGATGALGPADAQRLFVLPFQQAAGPGGEPEITTDDGEALDGETDGAGAPAEPTYRPTNGAGALGPTPLPSARVGEEAPAEEPPAEEPTAPRGEDADAGPNTTGWMVLMTVGIGLLALAVVIRAMHPKRVSTGR